MKQLAIGIILIIISLGCTEIKKEKKMNKVLTIREKGYRDGRIAMQNDSQMKLTYKNIQKKYNQSKDKGDKYVLTQSLRGSIEGTCLKLTWGKDKKDKSYEYQKAYEAGCWSVY